MYVFNNETEDRTIVLHSPHTEETDTESSTSCCKLRNTVYVLLTVLASVKASFFKMSIYLSLHCH